MKNKDPNTKIQYMPIFMSIGISIGLAIGAALGNIPLYMCVGLSVGVGIGTMVDAANKKNADDDSKKDEDKDE